MSGLLKSVSDLFKDPKASAEKKKEGGEARENAQLKAEIVRLQQKVERLEKRLEEGEEKCRVAEAALVAVGISARLGSSSSNSSLGPLIHSSSPLLAPVTPQVQAKEVKVEAKEVEQFLQHVAYGEQKEVEALAQKKPGLLLCKGNVTDLSKREFKEITGFQYALWALDWHMWRMLLKYMSKEAAALQFAELEEKGTAHGKHFSLAPLIGALHSYVACFNERGRREAQGEAQAWQEDVNTHWCQQVGGLQLLLPAHVVNECCHPDRSFVPIPTFKEENLPRSRQIERGKEWYTGEYNGGGAGTTFGLMRYNWAVPLFIYRSEGVPGSMPTFPYHDPFVPNEASVLNHLWVTRQQQLEALRTELIYFIGVNHHLPPVLTEIVVNYLTGDSATVSVPRM